MPSGAIMAMEQTDACSQTYTTMKTVSAAVFLTFLTISGVHAQESDEIKRLKAEAKSGDYHAAHDLALAYAVGDGVPKDLKESDHWYSVAASRRPQTTSDQASKEPFEMGVDQHTTRSVNRFWFENYVSRASQNPASTSTFAPTSAPQLEASGTSTWQKVFNALTAAPAKTQEFLSNHSDDITEVATFLLPKYIPGLDPSEGTISREEASTAGRTLQQYGEQQNK
jgi:hypothetical protein